MKLVALKRLNKEWPWTGRSSHSLQSDLQCCPTNSWSKRQKIANTRRPGSLKGFYAAHQVLSLILCIKQGCQTVYVVKGRISSVAVPVVFGYDGRVPAAIVVHCKS